MRGDPMWAEAAEALVKMYCLIEDCYELRGHRAFCPKHAQQIEAAIEWWWPEETEGD